MRISGFDNYSVFKLGRQSFPILKRPVPTVPHPPINQRPSVAPRPPVNVQPLPTPGVPVETKPPGDPTVARRVADIKTPESEQKEIVWTPSEQTISQSPHPILPTTEPESFLPVDEQVVHMPESDQTGITLAPSRVLYNKQAALAAYTSVS